jgi:hypothetical protein
MQNLMAVAGALALALCASGAARAQAPDSPLLGAWDLVSIAGARAGSGFLAFGPEGQFDGMDGCHAVSGHYSVEGTTLIIHAPAPPCPSPKAPAREKRVKAFQAVTLQGPEFEIEGDVLKLTSPRGVAVLRRRN